MITIKFFGVARIKFQRSEMTMEASSIMEMLGKIGEELNIPKKDMKNFLIFVNDVSIDKLKNFRTKLKTGDRVMMLSPSSGG